MTLHFSKRSGSRRALKSGFTLLEVLVSFAIVVLVMITVMETFAWSTIKQAEGVHDLWLKEFGESVLTEYSGAGPEMPLDGAEPGGWSWHLSEHEITPSSQGAVDLGLYYIQLTARVWNTARPDLTSEAIAVVARRSR